MTGAASTALVLTNRDDYTADYLCDELRGNGRDVVRLDTDSLPEPFGVGYERGEASLTLGARRLSANEIAAVWYRRPKPLALSTLPDGPGEAQFVEREWAEALEAVLAHVPVARWVNHPARNALASRKPEQLTRAAALGLRVPPTLVTQDASTLRRFWEESDGRLIAKPLRVGFVEREDPGRDTLIYTSPVRERDLGQADALARCPTLFQHAVDKSLDVRITAVDQQLVAVGLRATDAGRQRLDIRRDNMEDVVYSDVDLPATVREKLLKLLGSYGLRYAAVDFVVDLDGEWIFLEINPNGQWAWLDLVGAAHIAPLFDRAFFDADSV